MSSQFSFRRWSAVVALLTTILSGCGGSSETTTVTGQVTYRGEPLKNAVITFFPLSGRPITAPLAEQSSYKVDLPPGEYVVTVLVGTELPPGFKEGDPMPPPKIVLPPQYTTRARSKLTASVDQGRTQTIDFRLD